MILPHQLYFRSKSKTIDYQTPETKSAPTANITLHNDRTRKFAADSKKTPSLGGTIKISLD